MGAYDRSSKWLIQHYGDSLLKLAGVERIASWRPLQAEVVQPAQLPDGLIEVQGVVVTGNLCEFAHVIRSQRQTTCGSLADGNSHDVASNCERARCSRDISRLNSR